MGLNDLQLSPAVLTALYPSNLVNLDSEKVQSPKNIPQQEQEEQKAPENAAPVLKYLGNNQKNVLIVVNYTSVVHLPDAELVFLTNMLTACKLSLGDVVIVNTNNRPELLYKDLLQEFKSNIVLLFGIDPIAFGLPVSFPNYQVQNLANCTFLYTPPLEQQRNDSLLKSKLWVCLRSIFNI